MQRNLRRDMDANMVSGPLGDLVQALGVGNHALHLV